MRLTLVISSLARGGAERTMSLLASCWAEEGREVTLLTLDDGVAPAYSIHRNVRLRQLGLAATSKNPLEGLVRNLHRIWVLRRAIYQSRPDVVISFLDNVNILTLIATRGMGKPVVISERTDPSGYEIAPVWNALRRLTYRFADELVCQTETSLRRFHTMIQVKGRVIPNPVAAPLQSATTNGEQGAPTRRTLVAMGRLAPEKGFDLLLRAFARIAETHPDWALKILGDGPLRSQLEAEASDLKLVGQVEFAGAVTDPFQILCAADLFVLSSRVDGFPMALCEAMACGLPAISFDCPSGPRHIIRDGIDGILVPPEDVVGMAAALDYLMSNAGERQRLAARAPEVTARFNKDAVLLRWEELFNELLKSSLRDRVTHK